MAQHDYIIANQSGASFRADLNNGLAAVVTQNSGAAEPSTTYAYMTWADTTTGLFKIRNGANSAWIPLYKLDGTGFSVANGTAAAPSIFFRDSGTDTGIYSSGTDAVDIATAGVRRVGVSSAGDVTIYGQGDLRLADNDSSNYVGLQAPSTVSSNVVFTLPGSDGTSGQRLKTNGSGVLSFGGANSGEILKANSFYDVGSSTTSGSLVNANTSLFFYTPVSTNSTLVLIASFQAVSPAVAGVNTISYHAIGESGGAIGSTYLNAAQIGAGGISQQAPACIQHAVSNTSLSQRQFQMMHASNSGYAVSTTNIRLTILEVAN